VKIVINTVHGWFQLSYEATKLVEDEEVSFFSGEDHQMRTHPKLVAAVEKLGDLASQKPGCLLRVVTIPDDVDWMILADDGKEYIVDRKRTWNGDRK